MKSNFEQMSITELRAYVLAHRQDNEAIYALFHHPSLTCIIHEHLFKSRESLTPKRA